MVVCPRDVVNVLEVKDDINMNTLKVFDMHCIYNEE